MGARFRRWLGPACAGVMALAACNQPPPARRGGDGPEAATISTSEQVVRNQPPARQPTAREPTGVSSQLNFSAGLEANPFPGQ
jgi:hypothetical protein